MRDPNRIDRMVEKVRALWRAHPDLRLAQLVVNLGPPSGPLYYVEDDVLEKRMDSAAAAGFEALAAQPDSTKPEG